MFPGELNDFLRVFLRFTIEDHVHCPLQLGIEHFVHLFRGGLSVAVQQPILIIKGALIGSKMFLNRLAESFILVGRRSGLVPDLLLAVVEIEFDIQYALHIGQEIVHFVA